MSIYFFFQWNLLVRHYKEAKEYIEDIKDICDDFEGLCQRNLAANTGISLILTGMIIYYMFNVRFLGQNVFFFFPSSCFSRLNPDFSGGSYSLQTES